MLTEKKRFGDAYTMHGLFVVWCGEVISHVGRKVG
jgi:hypothetical protein